VKRVVLVCKEAGVAIVAALDQGPLQSQVAFLKLGFMSPHEARQAYALGMSA
jgi:hypothetical protein